MAMNAAGARSWARLTADNIGRSVAIVLDGYVYSAPRVNQEIEGGRSSITGNFTIQEAKDLANVLKSGKLPAPARIIAGYCGRPVAGTGVDQRRYDVVYPGVHPGSDLHDLLLQYGGPWLPVLH